MTTKLGYCSTSSTKPHPPTPLLTLPPLTFTDPSHFSVIHTTITRTEFRTDDNGYSLWSSALLTDPFTSGIVSITLTILSLPSLFSSIRFGLMDSNNPFPALGEEIGLNVSCLLFSLLIFSDSVGLSPDGSLYYNTPSSDSFRRSNFPQIEGDCVRMEVDLDSTLRTLQFFVNGEAGERYMSGIPSSVRIGFSAKYQGISFRIDNVSRLSRPTPIS
ncbi:hypothetical protein BLNAU_18438 [Blattamonas nauphoetae]|uniref:Uncharacterized protein n=1 Tax=Blattamonas nauphoetae TaxID=2049346 RepID=A0ABQ9X6S3_9EUKA|nr:hypothetical protein BLNAU_18438 [Blattamonas nauphoetae]